MTSAITQTRCLVLWLMDWPVIAWWLDTGVPQTGPVAVFEANQVIACSPDARAEGVYLGQRRREAQSRCPQLQVVAANVQRDEQIFTPLVVMIERSVPKVQVIRPGLAALRIRGPARYYGGEPEVAKAVLSGINELGVTGGRVGIADDIFTAEQAARDTQQADPIRVVPPGGSAGYLAPLSVNRLGDPELSELLPRLGVHLLGDFAAMAVNDVRDRFGARGVRLYELACGRDPREVVPRDVPLEFAQQIDFDPPLALAEQVAFCVQATAEKFITALAAQQRACTELRVVLLAEQGEHDERVWLHPDCFDAPAVVDRVRWQLQAAAGKAIGSPLTRVRLEPVATDAIAHHAPGLFGSGTDEKVHHVLSRVQAMLGHGSVVRPAIGGGRGLAERQQFVPWGDRAVLDRLPDRPWPGHLPDPLPATVFPQRRRVEVTDADGVRLAVNDRLLLTSIPARLGIGAVSLQLASWAGPWPIDERGWDGSCAVKGCRFQMADDTGGAWLLVLDEDGSWWAEGRYD